jgi:DNA polymerase delta subunit 1
MKGLHPASEEYKMCDANQLCFKLICNCIYGVTGVQVGKLAFRAIAEMVTMTGKEILHDLSESQKENFGGETHGGDTDSIFCNYEQVKKPEDLYEQVSLRSVLRNPEEYFARTGAKDCTKPRIDHYIDDANSRVPRPVFIEFEKIYEVWLGMARKRAYYIQSEPFFDPINMKMVFTEGEIQDKGSEIRRRDGCICAQEIIRGFVDILLWVSKKQGRAEAEKQAVEYAKKGVEKIMVGDVPYHHLIQARQLSSSHYATDNLPHVQVNKKLKKRGLQPYPLGSRVPFIVVKARKGTKMYQCAEDPDYALENGLEPDLLYIIMKKVYGPIERILKYFENRDFMLKQIFGKAMKKNYKVNLLEDDPISRYVKVLKPCEICNKPSMQVVCQPCLKDADWDKIFNDRERERLGLVKNYEETLAVCRACMAITESEEVLCVNSDCEKYFPRKIAEFAVSNFDKQTEELRQLRPHIDIEEF